MAPNLKELNRLAERFYPGHLFAVANYPDDHRSSMIFAKKSDLEQAVAEGFPCSLGQWTWKNFTWEKGVYPVVEVDQVPGEQQMKEMVLKELEEATKKGYPVPLVQPDQIYLTDMAEDGLLHVVVNGASESLNLRVDNRFHCDDDAWGLFLAYCLAKNFDEKVLLEKPVQRKWKQIERTVFLKEMEKRLRGEEEGKNSIESISQ